MSKFITIPGFSKMSAQKVFNMSAAHLLKQNSMSINSTKTTCAYRGERGKACAAGVFLTDEGARNYNGDSWEELILDSRIPKIHKELVDTLQSIHDGPMAIRNRLLSKSVKVRKPAQAKHVKTWPEQLRKLAQDFSLDDSVVDACKK